MIAISVRVPGQLCVESVDSQPLGREEVRVRIARAGICGSDLHIYHGSNPFARYPRIIGHEAAGKVTEVGADVTTLSVGDNVVLDPVVSCGQCYACRAGRFNVCANLEVFGVHRDGGFRSEMVLPAANAVKVSGQLAPAVAALAEPFSVAANVLLCTDCDATDTVLIYGAGTVGATVLQVAKLKGARVIVADPDRSRLDRALQFGADKVLQTGVDDIPIGVAMENDGLGPSVVIDGAGVPALLEQACRIAGPAGRIGLLGFSPAPCNVSQQEIVKKELTLVGSRLNRRLIPQVVDWLESGALKPEAMITQTFPGRDAAQAFALIESAPEQTIKVQLDFEA